MKWPMAYESIGHFSDMKRTIEVNGKKYKKIFGL